MPSLSAMRLRAASYSSIFGGSEPAKLDAIHVDLRLPCHASI